MLLQVILPWNLHNLLSHKCLITDLTSYWLKFSIVKNELKELLLTLMNGCYDTGVFPFNAPSVNGINTLVFDFLQWIPRYSCNNFHITGAFITHVLKYRLQTNMFKKSHHFITSSWKSYSKYSNWTLLFCFLCSSNC